MPLPLWIAWIVSTALALGAGLWLGVRWARRRWPADLPLRRGDTGMPNRAAALDYLVRQLSVAERRRCPTTVLVVQADARPSPARFLEQALARRLAPRLRAHEMLAHWGPAQFVVVLPDADVPGALVLAEDLRQLASAARDDGLAPVSVSIGVHGRRAGAEQDLRELAAEMVIAAQRALEATEANGPGRIEIEP
ncbi:MAG: diguanylate cyclase [Tepidimonas ignava]|uniref:GGDEF domain-containing protein n=1 Tax=Tepidimonas ignava TaxID=114249 RepID=A0A4R3LFP9_9BURK|nr:diguanylate cyclase [Tepidimonas ignava]TCS98305.1 GGDEF domain-containing protein [Tepidimonas ignava]TSE21814.1 GGDEF: diguanylate cyclase (GGDEF) domain protein [Tepidimonas ignava]